MDTKVTDEAPFGTVEQYAQLLRRTARQSPEFLQSCAFAIVQVVVLDPFIADARKVKLIKNLAVAVQLVEDEPAPAPAAPNYGRGDEGGQVVACPAHGAHPHENDGGGPLVCLDCPMCRPASVE